MKRHIDTGAARGLRRRIKQMGKIAFLFAGQGAQAPGMGKELAENFECANAVFEEAKVELIISGNTAVSPKNTSLTSATTKARRKNAIQM